MIIITNEMLDKAFGDMRVNGEGELYSWSVEALSKRDIYGKDVKYVSIYDGCSDPQKYVDNWMNSSVASMEVAEYYNNLSNTEDDNMNKYETLLKKYGALYKDFEDYRMVTEGLATEGVYIKNEALTELLEIKDKFNSLYKEHTVYCSAAEDVTVKLIEIEKKYDELKKENDVLKEERGTLIKEGCYLHDVIEKRQEKCRRLISENDTLQKECNRIKKERENLAQQVVYLKDKMKEKMDKIKQRDKQITELIRKNNVLKEERDCLLRKIKEEYNEQDVIRLALVKERDELKQRLEHINAMSNLEWKFEVVEETETTDTATIKTPYDELVAFCEFHNDGCYHCPKELICNSINKGLRPAKWNDDEKAEYNELMNIDIAEYCNKLKNKEDEDKKVTKPATAYDELVTFCETRRDGGKDCFGCPNEIACDGINPNFRPAKWTENQKEDYNELIAIVNNKEDK